VNDEREGIWEKGVIAYFKMLSWHSSARIGENHKNPKPHSSISGSSKCEENSLLQCQFSD
jgi:hypothetical protein